MKTIKETVQEFGIPFEWALERKKKYVCNLMGEIKAEINDSKKKLRQTKNLTEIEIIKFALEKLTKEFNSYQTYLRYLNNPKTDKKVITDDEIEIARNYPIHEFLPAEYRGKGNIKCFFHNDRHASCQVNSTFLYCHTCNKKWDAIDLTMHFRDLEFKEAVKILARS